MRGIRQWQSRTDAKSALAHALLARLGPGCILLLCLGLAAECLAQPDPFSEPLRIRRAPRALIRPAPAAAPTTARAATEDAPDPAEEKFPGGASLKTDPEQQRLLQRAEQCVADGRLDLAVILWQRVLDEAGDTLMTSDGRTYTSLAQEVERTLSGLDEQALKTYRITADGEAQAVLAKAQEGQEENALAEIVRRFFLSSHGDDAAYRLGCLALDRYDFVGAARLFTKILESHPDPSVPRAELLVRLAVASAGVSDQRTAEAALSGAATAPGARPSHETMALVAEQIKAFTRTGETGELDDWQLAFGRPDRTAHMRRLPTAATSRTLTELWVDQFGAFAGEQTTSNPWTGVGVAIVASGRIRRTNAQAVPETREQTIANWREHGWRPTQQLLFDSGRVYVKTTDDLAAFSTEAITEQPVWRSVWTNQYELDAMSQMFVMMASNANMQMLNSGSPKSVSEMLLFGDRVHQSMSIVNGVIYSIEGRRISKGTEAKPATPRGFQWGVTPRRSRTNWLAAYEAKSGKARWHRGASDEDKESSQDVGFLAAPVPFGNQLLLVPVTDGGTIYLYALNASDGSTAWKSYLCDEPAGGCSPWSAVQIAVDGRDAYVTCGAGVVFAVDAVSGSIRWAVRYARAGEPDTRMQQMYGQQHMGRLILQGWDDDLVIPHGKTLVVMSSDSNKLLALDRRTGELLWDSPRVNEGKDKDIEPVNYCLGVHGRGLFAAGKNVVRRYDIPSGRLVWEKSIEDSYGRGVVTGDAVYVPVKDSIVKFDVEKGTELGQVGVSLTTDDPVGNLYSDGEKLWVAGGGRVYAMTNLDHRLSLLESQIEAGDYEAQFNRMRLYAKQNKTELMLSDLRGAYRLCLKQTSPEEASRRLLDAIVELKLTSKDPRTALIVVAEAFAGKDASAPTGEVKSKLTSLLSSTLHNIRQKKVRGAIDSILLVAPLLEQDYLLNTASQAIESSATKTDADRLVEAVESDSPQRQIMASSALVKIAPQLAKERLQKLAAAKDDRVRLAATRGLLNLGERSSLETLVGMLESENARVRARSHQTLRSATGQQIAFASEAKPDQRAKGVEAWKTWLAAEGKSAKLKLPLVDSQVLLGRTLIASHVHSMVLELDSDHKERWRAKVPNPWGCQGLPNGHRLVAAYAQNAVIEFDDDGNEVWRKDRLPSPPYSVQRLDGGNTLVACADAQQLLEILPDGEVKTIPIQGRPLHATRLESGNTLVALQQGNRVVEIDPDQKIVWEAKNLNGPCFAQRLESGNTLVVQTYNGQVVELDASGQKTVWSSGTPLVNPSSAQRLPSGNTLVADNNGVHEIDADGKRILWSHRQNNVSGFSQY